MLLLKTCRFEKVGWDLLEAELAAGRGYVCGVCHCSLLAFTLFLDKRETTFIASQSKDGELIARILEKRGFKMIRGSSSKGGKPALDALLEAVRRKRAVGLTFDGPRGPACVPKPGIGVLAWQSGRAFVAFARVRPRTIFGAQVPFAMHLGSWDRFLLLFPFARVELTFQPVEVSHPHADRRGWIKEFLARTEALARVAYADLYANRSHGGKDVTRESEHGAEQPPPGSVG